MNTGQFSSGTVSNYFFSFVNAVAREVRKTHPDKYIATLAYWNYALPPRGFNIEPNVSVAPCLHTCVYAIHKEMRENDLTLYKEWLQKAKCRSSSGITTTTPWNPRSLINGSVFRTS